MDRNIRHGATRYISNLSSMLAPYGLTIATLPSLTHRALSDHHQRILLARVQSLSSLSLLPIPRVWWKLQLHVEESCWSRVLVRFRCMNAGLGNRDHYRSADSLSQDDGHVTVCPLCLLGPNTELHVLLPFHHVHAVWCLSRVPTDFHTPLLQLSVRSGGSPFLLGSGTWSHMHELCRQGPCS